MKNLQKNTHVESWSIMVQSMQFFMVEMSVESWEYYGAVNAVSPKEKRKTIHKIQTR